MKANCVICSDLLDGDTPNVTTPCGHVFHEVCVLQWLEYKSTCPACRRAATQNKLVKIYLTVSEHENNEKSSDVLENELSTLKASLRAKDGMIKKLQDRASEIQCFVVKAEMERDDVKKELMNSMGEVSSLRMQLRQMMKESAMNKKIITENNKLESQLLLLKNVEAIINGSQSDINEILQSYNDGKQNFSHMATYFTMIKKQLQISSDEKSTLQQSNREFRKKIGLLNSEIHEMKRKIESQQHEIRQLTENLNRLEDKGKTGSSSKRPNTSFGSPMTLDMTLQENTPTPMKRPKINMVNDLVKKLKSADDSDDDNLLVNMGKSIFNNKQHQNSDNNDSTIRQGYDGLGGHSKHIFRSAPIKLKMIKKNSFRK